MTDKVKKKVGRPKIKDSEKVIYQRVAFEYPVFKRFKEIVEEQKEKRPGITISQVEDEMIDLWQEHNL